MENTPSTNVAILKQAFNHLNNHDVDAVLAVLTPNFKINIAEMPYAKQGHAAWRSHAEILFNAFPDAQVHIDDIIASEDKVAVRVRVSGTHTGAEFLGARPSGRRVEYVSHEVYRFEDGMLAEEWICSDTMTLLNGLGVLGTGRLVMAWLAGSRFWVGMGVGALGVGIAWYVS